MYCEYRLPIDHDIKVWCFMSLTQFDSLIEIGYFPSHSDNLPNNVIKGELVLEDVFSINLYFKTKTTLQEVKQTYGEDCILVETSLNRMCRSIESHNSKNILILYNTETIQQKDYFIYILDSTPNLNKSFIHVNPRILIHNVYINNYDKFYFSYHINSLLQPFDKKVRDISLIQ